MSSKGDRAFLRIRKEIKDGAESSLHLLFGAIEHGFCNDRHWLRAKG
jgi:hypothetical protein